VVFEISIFLAFNYIESASVCTPKKKNVKLEKRSACVSLSVFKKGHAKLRVPKAWCVGRASGARLNVNIDQFELWCGTLEAS
jgi:hypothetical protein